MDFLTLVFAFIAFFLIFFFYSNKVNGEGEGAPIPRPEGLPLIGNIHQVGENVHEQINKWSEELGDIYKVQLGHKQ